MSASAMACRRRPRAVGLALSLLAAASPCFAAQNRDEWQQPDRVVADMALAQGAVVADVGCGAGYFTFRLAKAVGDSGKVFAEEISATALQQVRERVAREQIKNVEPVLGEPADTKLPPDRCDAVLLCDVLHEAPQDQRAPLVRNAARALKPGGFLFLIDYRKSRDVPFDPYEKLIPRDDLLQLAADAGLSLDAELHYLKYQVAFRLRKPPKK